MPLQNVCHIGYGALSKIFLNIVIRKVKDNYKYQMITTKVTCFSFEIVEMFLQHYRKDKLMFLFVCSLYLKLFYFNMTKKKQK